ncbi:MAG: RluA family pseudouridine synthase [Planctomycetota bacterium]|nr:RluA family pseudouridine synthase [Planctomycetota bacterium]
MGTTMVRPRFPSGSTGEFFVACRSGKKDLAGYLGSRLGVAEAWAADLLALGCVSLDGRIAHPGETINLSAGPHRLAVHFPEAWPRHMAAVEMPLSVLYEDPWLIALDKPPGIVVHPARGHLDNRTLQNGVRYRFRNRLNAPDTCLAPPHRLDRNTSGVIVFALVRKAYAELVRQFSERLPRKTYLAILDGQAGFSQFSHRGDIAPDPERKGFGRVVPPGKGGKAAWTDFHILESGRDWSLAKAILHTGRQHQIRVHAADLGLPLVGDDDYNPDHLRHNPARQALHAAVLEFDHPLEPGRRLRIEAPLPSDFQETLVRLRQRECQEPPR